MRALLAFAGMLLLSVTAPRAVAADASAARRAMRSGDLYGVLDVNDPQVSPDGLWVAYVVSSNNREADEPRSAIWMASWDGSRHVALTPAADGTSSPKWSPDGRYLAFIASPKGGDNQIMLLDRRGGEARPLTAVSGEIGDYAWAPDGKRLAYSLRPSESDAALKPIVIDALVFKDEQAGYLGQGRARHLYFVDVETKHVEPLSSDPQFNDDLPAWSPDGRHIAFIRTREPGGDADGREDIDVAEPVPDSAPRTVARPYAPNKQSLAWSPNGLLIAYLQGLEPKYNAYIMDRLAVVPAAGGASQPLTDQLDRAVNSFAFAAGSASIWITVEDDGRIYPARVDLASQSISREAAPGRYIATSLSSAAGHTTLLLSDDRTPAEVYALDAGRLRKLTAHNDAFLSQLELGAVEDIRFNSKDGTEIHGLLVKPPAYVPGHKYPTVLWIHGGPVGQDEHSLVLDGYQFEPQLFAAKGFVVLRVNYRGGSGRGGTFARAIFADWGHREVEDLLAGVDYLVARGIADADRLAIGGWSYGGMLTDYAIASDDRFKAAISGAGCANQLSIYGTDDSTLQNNNELGPPWRDTALWLKVSYPFFHADRIHTPTLFLGGSRDFRVPISGGEQMYQALRTLGVPTQLVVYPGEHHVFSRPSFLKDLADRMSAWLDRYVPPAR